MMKPFRRRIPRHRRRAAERGVALILVMLFLGLMLLLGLAATMTSITEVTANGNLRLQTEAFNAADAGAVHAFELVRNMKGDFTCLLRGTTTASLHDGDEFEARNAQIYDTSGTITNSNAGAMWDTAKATPITHTAGSDGVSRALVKIDDTHFYELLVYDNAKDDNSYMSDAPREVSLDPNNGTPATAQRTDCDQRVMVRSIGYVMSSATTLTSFLPTAPNVIASAVVDEVIGLTPYPAVISNDDLEVTNSSTVGGDLGGVHANDDLLLGNGNYTIAQTATYSNQTADTAASGANQTTDSSHVAGYNGAASVITIPDLIPYNYANQCDYYFIAKGSTQAERQALCANLGGNAWSLISADTTSGTHFILSRSGSTYTLVSSSTSNNYSTTTASYTVSCNNGDAGISAVPTTLAAGKSWFFLVQAASGNKVQINGGTDGYVSLMTNANVLMNGNANLKPVMRLVTAENPPWDTISIMALAGMDIKMQGNASSTQWIEGVLYSHEQFNMTGSGNLKGQVVGYEQALTIPTASPWTVTTNTSSHSASTYVGAGQSIVSGNFEINHSDSNGYIGNFSIAAWRQLHDFNPVTAARP